MFLHGRHGDGCDFVEKSCLVNDGKNPVVPDYGKGYFCTNASERGCPASHDYKMGCMVIGYSLIFGGTLPEDRFQYFPDDPALGGPKQADYCPLYGSTYKRNIISLTVKKRIMKMGSASSWNKVKKNFTRRNILRIDIKLFLRCKVNGKHVNSTLSKLESKYLILDCYL